MLPHEPSFRYRKHLFVLALLACFVVNLVMTKDGVDLGFANLAFVAVPALAGYLVMRLFVFVGCGVMRSFPGIGRVWALSWFYGAIPLSVVALYIGTQKTGGPPAEPAFVVCVAAAALGFAAGASRVFELLRETSNKSLEPTR